MEPRASSADKTSRGVRDRYEEKTVRAIRGRERSAITKAEAEGWTVVRQESGKVQTTLELRKPRASTAMEAFLDRLPWVGGMADSRRPLVFIGAGLAVLALVITPLAILTSGDDEPAPVAATTAAVPATTEPEAASATTEPAAAPSESEEAAAPEAYAGPAYEVVEIDSDAVLGEQDELWVYSEALDPASPSLKEDVKALIEDVAWEQGTPNLTVNVVTDREIIAARSANTMFDFEEEKGMDYVVDVVRPKEATDRVVMYSGGIDLNLAELSDEGSAYTLDWWPAGDHESENWKPRS